MPNPRLRVELLVCPHCRHIGKVPLYQGLKGFCVGSPSKDTAHKKVRMVPVQFSAPAPVVEAGGVK